MTSCCGADFSVAIASHHMGETSQGSTFGDMVADFDEVFMTPFTQFLHRVFCEFFLSENICGFLCSLISKRCPSDAMPEAASQMVTSNPYQEPMV